MRKVVIAVGIVCVTGIAGIVGCVALARSAQREMIASLPVFDSAAVIENHEWQHEEAITILDYTGDAMEAGISVAGEYLLFNDNVNGNKDLHWSLQVDDVNYQYMGRVQNSVSDRVDGTPSFDATGYLYFTSLKEFPEQRETIYRAGFVDGVAMTPEPVTGNIYVRTFDGRTVWVSLDPDISDDGRFLFYSEGRFVPGVGFPYPFNIRGAVNLNGEFMRMGDDILANVNSKALDYAPTISTDGLELFFSRIARVNDRPGFVGVYTATRNSVDQAFAAPQKIMAITGEVEAPVLSGDETQLYYHKRVQGVFQIFRVTRKDAR